MTFKRSIATLLILAHLLFNSVLASAHMGEEQSALHEPAHIHIHMDHHEHAPEHDQPDANHEHEGDELHCHFCDPVRTYSIFQKSSVGSEVISALAANYSTRLVAPPTPPPTF